MTKMLESQAKNQETMTEYLAVMAGDDLKRRLIGSFVIGWMNLEADKCTMKQFSNSGRTMRCSLNSDSLDIHPDKGRNTEMDDQNVRWYGGEATPEEIALQIDAYLDMREMFSRIRIKPLNWEKRDVWFAVDPLTKEEHTIFFEEGLWWGLDLTIGGMKDAQEIMRIIEDKRKKTILHHIGFAFKN